MVVHKDTLDGGHEPSFVVVAELIEPDYEVEFKFLETETEFVKKKMAQKPGNWSWVSLPAWGFFSPKDWRKYHHALVHYAKQLEDYAEEVAEGVLPVKFAVYNASARPDEHVMVRVRVEGGRVDTRKKPPVRPERMDGAGHNGTKFSWPKLITGFTRRNIKLGPHVVAAELSSLDVEDAAMLVNQLVHVHCEPNTEVTYEIRSMNVAHESGEVEF